jgi:hypothetical protein
MVVEAGDVVPHRPFEIAGQGRDDLDPSVEHAVDRVVGGAA